MSFIKGKYATAATLTANYWSQRESSLATWISSLAAFFLLLTDNSKIFLVCIYCVSLNCRKRRTDAHANTRNQPLETWKISTLTEDIYMNTVYETPYIQNHSISYSLPAVFHFKQFECMRSMVSNFNNAKVKALVWLC